MRFLFSLMTVAVLLGGCSSQTPGARGLSSVLPGELTGVVKALLTKNKATTPGANPLAGVSRAQLKGVKGPLIVANLETSGAYAALSQTGENAGVRTFVTTDRISLSLRDGVILATRGLGDDLMSADVSASVAALKGQGGGQYHRRLQWLDAQDQTQTRDYTCKMTNRGVETITILGTRFSTRHLVENCAMDGETYQNDYWLGTSRTRVWQSRQWLGGNTGYIKMQLLIE